MNVVAGIVLLITSWGLLVGGLFLGLVASIDCLMYCESTPLSTEEIILIFGSPILAAGIVAFFGAKTIISDWLVASVFASVWILGPTAMLFSMARSS